MVLVWVFTLVMTYPYIPGSGSEAFKGLSVLLGLTVTLGGLGEEVTLPNSTVLTNAIKNYSRTIKGQGYIVDTVVTIGYDVPWRQVHSMLAQAALATPAVLPNPVPRVFQTALSDFYVEYRLACQATADDPRSRAEVLSALHQNVQDVFNEHGVQIMSPHYLGDPSTPTVVPQASWYGSTTPTP